MWLIFSFKMSNNYGFNSPFHNDAGSNSVYSNSRSFSYGQVAKLGNAELWRDTGKSSNFRDGSRITEKTYPSERSSRRSRSKSHSTSRYKRYPSASHSRSRERSTRRRSRSPHYDLLTRYSYHRLPVEGVPACTKVLLISLPVNTDKDIINLMISKQGFHSIKTKIVQKTTDSGAVRAFGFVEFDDSVQAQAWINYNNGFLVFDDGYMVKLEFFHEDNSDRKQQDTENSAAQSSDWTCFKCNINNFHLRTSCFKCGTLIEDSRALEAKGFALVGLVPCDTLLVRELPASATEESLRRALSKYTSHVIQRMQISSSKKYALLQMKSVEDAVYVIEIFSKVVPHVDNCAVLISFSRQSLNKILINDNANILKSQSGITSAVHNDATSLVSTRKKISTPFGYLQLYSTPNPKSFQLEPDSGYFYDVDTAFYYDSKTEYYYNQKTNQWMFWCSKYSTYIPCEGGDQDLKKSLQQEQKDSQKIKDSAVISLQTALASDSAVSSEKGVIADALKAALEQNQKLVEALKGQLGTRNSGGSLALQHQQPASVSSSFKSPPIPPSPRRFDDTTCQQYYGRNSGKNLLSFGRSNLQNMEICNDNSFVSPKPKEVTNSWRNQQTSPSKQWRQPSLSLSLERDSRTVQMLPPFVPFQPSIAPPAAQFQPSHPPPAIFAAHPPSQCFVGMTPQPVGYSSEWSNKPAASFPNNEDHWSMSTLLQNRVQSNTLPVQPSFGFNDMRNSFAGQPVANSQKTFDVGSRSSQLGYSQFIQNQSGRVIQQDKQKKSTLISKEQDELKALNICFNCGGRNHQQFSCRFKRISDDHLQQIIARAKERLAKEQIMKQDLKKQAESYKCNRKDLLIKRLRALAPHGKITKEHLRVMCDKCSMLGHMKSECKGRAVDTITSKNIRALVNDFSKRFFFHLMDENLIDFSRKFALFEIMDSIEKAGIDPVKMQLEALCPKKVVTQKDLVLCSNCSQLGHKSTHCAAESVNREHYSKMLQLVTAYRALVKEHGGSYKLKPTAAPVPGQIDTMDVIILDDEEDEKQRKTKEPNVADEQTVDSDDDVVLVLDDENDDEMVLLEEETAEDDDVDTTLVIAEEENGILQAKLQEGEQDDIEAVHQTLTSIVEEIADQFDTQLAEGPKIQLKETTPTEHSFYKSTNVSMEDSDDDIIFIS